MENIKFPLKFVFNIGTLSNDFTATNAEGRTVAYVKQKLFKLKEKIRIGARIKKKYDKPMTPYERVLLSQVLTKQEEKEFIGYKSTLNPFTLKKELDSKLEKFFKLKDQLNIRKAA